MVLIYSVIFAILFSLLLSTSIRKQALIYYILASVVTISTVSFEIYKLTSKIKLYGFINDLERASAKGIIAVAFFVLVMYAGALSNKLTITKKLMSIRAELAIIASILMLSHGITYLISFLIKTFPKLLNGQALSIVSLCITVVGIIAFIVMIPLFITSFKNIRKKMKPLKWKKLQRWAYLFYCLAYLHIILILLNAKHTDWTKMVTYNVIFGVYLILKIIKYITNKR